MDGATSKAVVMALVGALACATSTSAQVPETTDASSTAQRVDPVTVTPPAPSSPGVLKRMRNWEKDVQLLDRMAGNVDGWYPRIGGITRGSGVAGGAGLRTPFGDEMYLDVSAAVSTKGYSSFDTRVRWLQAFERRVEVWTDLRFEDFTEEDYLGTGMATTDASRTSYDYDSMDARVRFVLRPHRQARISTLVGFVRPDVARGGDSSYPSTEDLFTDAEAPGLFEQPHYVQASVIAEFDTRDTAANTTRGGYYRFSAAQWSDVSLEAYSFHRVDVVLSQYVPITPDKAHVLSGRIGSSFMDSNDGDRVPFYYLAYVGGLDTIRSFREYRFRDTNALWFTGEYKWRPKNFLSVSVFADAGAVSPTWDGFTLKALRPGYGAGIALHGPRLTIIRMDVGTGGGDGWQYFLRLRPTF